MGRRIDRAARWTLGASAAYFYFLNAWRSSPLACLAAFAAVVLARELLNGLPRRARRCTKHEAEAELLRIASLSDDEAQRALDALVRGRCPDEACALTAILKHPGASLSPSDVLGAWKANRGGERLVIAATCGCDPAAVIYARELTAPVVAIVDAAKLTRIIRESGFLPPEQGRPPCSARRAWRSLRARIAAHRPKARDVFAAAALLSLYARSGHRLLLVFPLTVLLRFGMTLGARRRRSLFE